MIENFQADFGWLSNFWSVPVVLDGEGYASVEAAYQAGKTVDLEIRKQIRGLPTAGRAKRFGAEFGKSMPFRPGWNDEFKINLMRDLLRQKFTHPDLRQRLLATGDEILVEGNCWHDQMWGRCSCVQCGGRGENWLGRLLMEVREECRKGNSPA